MSKTGRLEVAEAIAAVSGLVTVTLLGNDDFNVDPDDLFDLTFDDPKVGFSNNDMKDFRAALKTLLKGRGVNNSINQIPDNAAVGIGKIATIIRLALALEVAHKDITS
jgi:hypothetical protein